MDTIRTFWHHSPPHVFCPNANYMITAGTFKKYCIFNTSEKLSILENTIQSCLKKYKWTPIAWAVMSNHYHFIASSPDKNSTNLKTMIKEIHTKTAITLNQIDTQKGRKVWFEYWDSCLTYENSYYARLKYVMNNPVHHGIVANAEDYQHCSAGYFKLNADKSIRKRLETYSFDKLKIPDDF